VLPDDQALVEATPDMTAGEALALMDAHKFSQLPIVSPAGVVGVFSYRSFARGAAKSREERDTTELPVTEFVEPLRFARTTDAFDDLLDVLDSDDAVLVGSPARLVGIATPMDVLRYLYELANAYVLLQEIELALRELIRRSTTPAQLEECAARALAQHYAPESPPRLLEDMTFHDYVTILGRGDTWSVFEDAFGRRVRKRLASRLKGVQELRNATFHFKRKLTVEDHEELRLERDWLLMRLQVSSRPEAPGPERGDGDE
jgi:CBS domain-containing protein